MATSAACIDDLTLCPICMDVYDDPRSLPCLHTFCLKCTADHCAGKLPGETAACPMCREDFAIPSGGVASLRRNFFVSSLLSARASAVASTKPVDCECCGDETGNVATVSCTDCCQKMCSHCSIRCKKAKGGSHNLLTLDGRPYVAATQDCQAAQTSKIVDPRHAPSVHHAAVTSTALPLVTTPQSQTNQTSVVASAAAAEQAEFYRKHWEQQRARLQMEQLRAYQDDLKRQRERQEDERRQRRQEADNRRQLEQLMRLQKVQQQNDLMKMLFRRDYL